MVRNLAFSLLLATPPPAVAADCGAATNCALLERSGAGTPFSLVSRVTAEARPHFRNVLSFKAEDASGAAKFAPGKAIRPVFPRSGDLVRLSGRREPSATEMGFLCNYYTNAEILASGPPPRPHRLSAAEFLDGSNDWRLVRLDGTVRDVFRDENDPDYRYLILLSGDELVYAATPCPPAEELPFTIGSEVALTGICEPCVFWNRAQIGRTLQFDYRTAEILNPGSGDPFAVPPLEDLSRETPARVVRLGRRKAAGRVLAVWNGRHALLREGDGRLIGLSFAHGNAPEPGVAVEAVGFPETDLYRLKLVRSV